MATGIKARKPARARDRRFERWHALYAPVEHVVDVCVYCGRGGKIGDDHVPPLAAAWVKGERLLYPCCPVCNLLMSAYPLVCIEMRAEYLLCRLRAEWARTKAGQAKRFDLVELAECADGVKTRLREGRHRADCRCHQCQLTWRARP